jgi:hypothetical protein
MFSKHEYPDMESIYTKFEQTIDHKPNSLFLIRKQLFKSSIQRIGGKSLYQEVFDSINKRTEFWIQRSKYRSPECESIIFMDSLILFNKQKNIVVGSIYNIIPSKEYYLDRSKTKIIMNNLGKRDTIIIKDSVRFLKQTDFIINVYFKNENNRWIIFHEQKEIFGKLGFMNIAHKPIQMKLLGTDNFFFSFINVKNEFSNNPKIISYKEHAFNPKNNWYHKTFDDKN